MITRVSTSIFHCGAEFICNPVNCVGVMGAGLAKDFRIGFPSMYQQYKADCSKNLLRPGKPRLWLNPNGGHHVINFPTKDHWAEDSKPTYIAHGLQYLQDVWDQWGITTLAVPALGCGLGGMQRSVFESILETYFGEHKPEYDVIYCTYP